MNNSDLVTKENIVGIVNHWALAVSCIVLTISGFGFLFQMQGIGSAFGGFPAMKGIHNWAGVVFTVSLVLSMFNWLMESLIFDSDDLSWILTAGGYLSHNAKVPPMHKLNTGQKFFYLTLLVSGFAISVTGFIIWLMPEDKFLLVSSHFIHNVSFIIITAFLPIHIYLSTLGNPGTLQIMITGKIPYWRAKKKYPKWVKELEEGHRH
ncbi:MAG: formate dehydrogenase subunit gamma [Dissulfurispiraceae bacterium]|jgi:formate dehydrogenase subunit gamma